MPKSDSPDGRPVSADVMAPPHPDWLYHHLLVAGAPTEVARFRAAAAGPGIIPWQHDLERAAEDWFHLLMAPPAPQRRTLSLEGAQILAAQLREAAEHRQRWVLARAEGNRGCALDLHRLLPVPAAMLRLGPEHPDARAWLWEHWGTTQALRKVVVLPVPRRGQPAREVPGRLWVGFWSADWTPWRAIVALRHRWPDIRFEVRPIYDDE